MCWSNLFLKGFPYRLFEWPNQQLNHKVKMNCQPIEIIPVKRYQKAGFDAQKTLVTIKYKFSKTNCLSLDQATGLCPFSFVHFFASIPLRILLILIVIGVNICTQLHVFLNVDLICTSVNLSVSIRVLLTQLLSKYPRLDQVIFWFNGSLPSYQWPKIWQKQSVN